MSFCQTAVRGFLTTSRTGCDWLVVPLDPAVHPVLYIDLFNSDNLKNKRNQSALTTALCYFIIISHWLNGWLLLNLPLGRTDKSAAPACRQWQHGETRTLCIWQGRDARGRGGGGVNQPENKEDIVLLMCWLRSTVHSLQLDDNLSGLPRQVAHIPVAIKVGN